MEQYFQFMQENGRTIPKKCLLAIVCNIKSRLESADNYGSFSTDTEFLSDDELQQLTKMALAQDIAFRIFTDEDSFLRYILTPNTNMKNIIVYNSAQSGIGAGRKALIPSICNYYHIRHTGSDAYRVSLCRDKLAVSALLTKLGIKVPQSYIFHNGELSAELNNEKRYIAKPVYESASIGIQKENIFYGSQMPIMYLKNLEKTMQQPLIIQEFISGYELEVPILVGKKSSYIFSPVVLHKTQNNLVMGEDILDYNSIYHDEYLFSSLPHNINDEQIKQTAKIIAEKLSLSGLCRVDFRLKDDNSFYVTDVSTNPHFIHHSSVNYAFKRKNLTDAQLFHTILELS